MEAASPLPAEAPLANSIQQLELAERKVVEAVDLAGQVVAEMGRPGGPSKATVQTLTNNFLHAMKEVQTIFRAEIRNMPDQLEFENCDYVERIRAENTARKLECLMEQLKDIHGIVRAYDHIGETRRDASDDAHDLDLDM